MKFKGVISHEGMRALERLFLPSIEKFGARCFLMFTPEDVYLIQDVDDAGGMQTSARLETVSKRAEVFFLVTDHLSDHRRSVASLCSLPPSHRLSSSSPTR